MTASIPFETVAGERLSPEQLSYLDGIFAGLRNRGVAFTDIAPNPAAAPPAAGDLILEERVKRELHPLDAYDSLLEHAIQNKAPDKENLFRFKWHGLFHLSPHKDGFMARLRIPGGQLKTFQAREIARTCQELTTGYLQVTTRANFQLRMIQPKDAPEVLARIQSVGLHTRGAGADNVRNITTNATAGLDPNELIDTMPLVHQLAQAILNQRAFYDLPRKFNIAIDSGGASTSLEDTNDIGATAVRIGDAVKFRLAVGGATGHKAFANDLGVLVEPAQLIRVLTAMLRVYVDNGERGNRKRARLKHLLERWPLQKYLEETEKLLGFPLERSTPPDAAPPAGGVPHPHIGVHSQKQAGFSYVGVALPVGQLSPKQLLRLCDLADSYGAGELRLTVWQNVVIPHVRDAFVEPLKKALVKMGLDWKHSNLRSGLVACTGNSYCKFAAANTKQHALDLASYLEKRVNLDAPINIHLTGCPNSCAQHYIGDIGLLGAQVKVAGETREGYHVFVGGGFGTDRSIGRQLFQGISIEQLKPTLEKMLTVYMNSRKAGEPFREFTSRHDIGQLQAMFS
jgi:ferredoxin-nitrite reductase